MKVLFLDFDGVLNSEASFRHELRRKNKNVSNSLSVVSCSNLQYILERDSAVKIVISSTWRNLHTMVELQNILNSYGVEAARIIGKTPASMSGHRGREIRQWLDANPGVLQYVVLDDDGDARGAFFLEDGVEDLKGLFIQTSALDGLLLKEAIQASMFFRGEK